MKNLKKAICLLSLLASVQSPLASAAFVIEYPVNPPVQIAEVSKERVAADLLLDKSVDRLVHIGTVHTPKGEMLNSVQNLSFGYAMQLLLPDKWKLQGEKGVDISGVTVDWEEGDTWLDVLEGIGEANDLLFEIHWADKEVFTRLAPDEGLLSEDIDPSALVAASHSEAVETPLHTPIAASVKVGAGEINVNPEVLVYSKPMEVFTVEKGTLRQNAERLSEIYGLKVYHWRAKNFMITIPYTMHHQSIDEAFEILFLGFPVQAQIIDTGVPGEEAVTFVKRRVVRK